MKTLVVFILSSFLFFSCSDNWDKSIIKETSDITNWYVDTLEWSIKDAKDVKALIEEKDNKLEDELIKVND